MRPGVGRDEAAPAAGRGRGPIMCLESATLRRMAECFAGRACHRCGGPAVRLAHGRFYCDRHFPPARAEAGRPPKVRRCLLLGEGRWEAATSVV